MVVVADPGTTTAAETHTVTRAATSTAAVGIITRPHLPRPATVAMTVGIRIFGSAVATTAELLLIVGSTRADQEGSVAGKTSPRGIMEVQRYAHSTRVS